MTTHGLLAIDVGLTNVKAVVFGISGELIARTAVSYPTNRPMPDAVEQDPAAWWSAVVEAVHRLPVEVRKGVVALGVTAHMHALTTLGRDGEPIGPALILGDRRATRDAAEISDRVGADEIVAITGADLDPSMPAAKAHYLHRRDPDAWRSVAHLLGCKDYLRYRLTGEIATEPIDACATSLYDIRSGGWSDPLVEAAGVLRTMLPPVMAPWAVAGFLVRLSAKSLGLRVGTPVVIGAGDDVVVLGFGLLDPGVALEHIGTTGSMMAIADHMIYDPERGLELYPHVLPDRWVVGGSHTTAGAALAWASDLLGYGSVDAALATLATAPEPGLSFLPTLAGERFPARVAAARGAWVGLTLKMTRETLMRAAFEGVAVALGAVLNRIDAVVGRQETVRVATADDPRWLALRAATYGRGLEVSHTSEPTALGLASLIAVAGGAFPDVRTAVTAMARVDRAVRPEPGGDAERLDWERLLRNTWDEAAAAQWVTEPSASTETSHPSRPISRRSRSLPMRRALWLGIELGSQGARTVLADTSGRVVGKGHAVFRHRADPTGTIAKGPIPDWTRGTLSAIHAAIKMVDPAEVAGVGVCGHFRAPVCLDNTGQRIGDGILDGNFDAGGRVRQVDAGLNDALCGDDVPSRLLRLRETLPNEFERAATVVGPTGFIVHLLTGRAVIDRHSASRWGGLLDEAQTGWSGAASAALGLDVGLLPDVVAPHEWVGSVTSRAASATGLAVGTPVIGGTTDIFATLVGHGAVQTGDIVVHYGSSWMVLAVTIDLEVILRDPARIDTQTPWLLLAQAVDAGRFIEQLRLSVLGGRPYDELDAVVAAVPAGARGVRIFPSPTGRLDGSRIRGAVLGFGLEHGPADLWRAALESFGHIAAQGLERVDSPIGLVAAAGGGARSAPWRAIVDGLTGVRQRYSPQASAAFGAAFLAAFGLGGVRRLNPIAKGWLSDDEMVSARRGAGATDEFTGERRAWRIYERALAYGMDEEAIRSGTL